MPGPPPKPNAVRRNPRVGMVRLPSGGRRGRTPKWPLLDNPRLTARIDLIQQELEQLEERELDEELTRTEKTKLTRMRERLAVAIAERDAIRETEKQLWSDLWHTPQACEWERLRWTREVAQYVRHKAAAECGSLEESKEARVRAQTLGLTPTGLRALMWVIDHDEVGERRQEKDEGGTQPPRRRLAAVDTKSS